MCDIQNRLRLFLDTLNISMQTFERCSGISQGLGSRLSNKSYATTFKRISLAYPQLNIDWLKTGEGEMLNPGSPKTQTVGSGIGIQGNVGHDVTQMNNSEKILLDFVSGLKSQNKLIEKAMEQTERAMSQTDKLIEIIQNNLTK